jgi:hypothetical protein
MNEEDFSWFLRAAGRITGPYSRAQLGELRQRSRFMAFHEVSPNKVLWSPAIDLFPELFGQAVAVSVNSSGTGSASTANPASPGPKTAREIEYLHLDGKDQQIGPVTESTLRSMVESGELSPSTRIWTSGMSAWDTIENRLGIRGSPRKRPARQPDTQSDFDPALAPRAQHGLFLLGVGLCLAPLYPIVGAWGLGILLGLGGLSRGVARNALLLLVIGAMVAVFSTAGYFIGNAAENELWADRILRVGLAIATALFCLHSHFVLYLLSRMARSTGVLLWAQISAVMQLNQIIGDLFWTGYFITLVWDLDGPVLMRPAFLVLGGFFSLVTLVGMIHAAFGVRQSLPGLKV